MKVVLLVLVIVLSFSAVSSAERKPKAKHFIGRFGSKLNELRRDCLGVDQIQNAIDAKVTIKGPRDGKEIISRISSVIRRRFADRIAAIQELKKGVEEDYARKAAPNQQCCKLSLSSMKVSSRFKAKVNTGQFCEMRSSQTVKEARGLGDNVMEAMYNNLKKNHRQKWQFFGSAEGVTAMFPSSPVKECRKYDNRVRPWYVTTASSASKNIVIVLDTSTSMDAAVTIGTLKTTRLAVAKAAVKSVLNTLLQEDQVSVVLFSTRILLPEQTDGCYSTRLASASSFNVNELKTFVSGAKPGGGTHYKKAFDTAFRLLKNSPNAVSKTRQSVVLFITDGAPNDQKNPIIQTIKKHQHDMKSTKNKVVVMTYGIGTQSKMRAFLKRLSEETGTINIPVYNIAHLHTRLTSYYEHLKNNENKAFMISPPYVDAWGLGVLITVAMPCARNGVFKGVVGIDITLPDLLAEIQYFNQAGPDSYAFIAHLHNGNVLSHPLVPPPETVTKDPSLVHIFSLERGDVFKKFFEQLKNLKGSDVQSKSIPGQRGSLSRGGMNQEGIHEITSDYQYHCSRVMELVACVVIADNDWTMSVKDTDGRVAYHRMDLVHDGPTCYYADSVSYQDKSVVKFSAKAFSVPPEYLDVDETPSNITHYMNYINNQNRQPVFLSGIRETTKIGASLEQLWLHADHAQYLTQIPRRFFGTFNGVLRFFPGEPLPLSYDHSNRHWYLKAQTYPNQLMFTTPYRDPLGAGIIVTISQSITMATHNPNQKNLFGVVAADLTLSYFDTLVKNELGFRCKDARRATCFLVDSSGFVVFHPRFAQRNVYDDVSIVTSKHITEIHGHVASHLIKTGVMKKKQCQNFSDRKLQIFYELDLGDDDIIQNMEQTTGRCDTFAMTRVRQTNIFIVAAFASAHSRCYDSASCPCGQTCAAATNATSCECPCTTRLDYNYCSDTIKETSIPSCTSPSAKVSARPPLPKNIAALSQCFNPQCEEIESEGSCRKTFGCSWCKWEEAKELEIPFCSYDNECYGGIRGRSNPFLREIQNTARNATHDNQNAVVSKNTAIIIVSVVGSALLLIISAICNCCLRRKKPEEDTVMDEEYYNEHAIQDGMYPQGYQDDGYMYQDGYEQEGYVEQDGGEYPQEGGTEEQQYFAGEEPLAENEMFDDF